MLIENDKKHYYVVKYVDGKPWCAWVSEKTLKDEQLIKYVYDEQLKKFTIGLIDKNSIIGYWDYEVKNGKGY